VQNEKAVFLCYDFEKSTKSCKSKMTRKKLPIGIQTFAKIREENCYYVDKTPNWKIDWTT